MIDKVLNVLMLEDLKNDAELIKRQVLKAAPNSIFNVARNRAEFFDKLTWSVPDIILADYRLPDFNGLEALLHVRQTLHSVPFIFISGTLNDEEKVAEAVLKGASGYVLKENLQQLPERFEQVLQRADTQKEYLLEAELRQQHAHLSLQKAIAMLDKASGFPEKEEVKKLLTDALVKLQELSVSEVSIS